MSDTQTGRMDRIDNLCDSREHVMHASSVMEDTDMCASPEGRVFIAYSHDSKEHMKTVLALCNRLRKDGIDCDIDQYHEQGPPEGWPRWMIDRIRDSKYVLVICTQEYYRKCMSGETVADGKGTRFESLVSLQDMYDHGSINKKFIPIIFRAEHVEFIPECLRPFQHYTVCVDSVDDKDG
jgi:hypothetical protein